MQCFKGFLSGLKGLLPDTIKGILRIYAVLLVALPILLTLLLFRLYEQERMYESEKRNVSATLEQNRIRVDTWLSERMDDVRFMTQTNTVLGKDHNLMLALFNRYRATHDTVADIVFVSAAGYSEVSTAGDTGIYSGDRFYFKEAQAGRTALVGGIVGRASGRRILVLSAPVNAPDGAFTGVIFFTILQDNLDLWLRRSNEDHTQRSIIADTAGTIIVPVSAPPDEAPQGRIKEELLHAPVEGIVMARANGEEVICASTPMGLGGWRLIQMKTSGAVFLAYKEFALLVGLGTLAATLLAAPVILRFARRIERPLETLCHFANQVREGRYEATCPHEALSPMPREVRELCLAFQEMSSKVREHIEETERLSVLDSLTGLHNRRFLYAGGVKMLAAAERSGKPCSCLMIDVDHFKAVNDTHGHLIGDIVLKHVASRLSCALRASDLLARYGGEEFTALLIGADEIQAATFAERLRATIANTPCPTQDGPAIPITVSIGVAAIRTKVSHGRTPLEDALFRADLALYEAKAAGRNRVSTAPEDA